MLEVHLEKVWVSDFKFRINKPKFDHRGGGVGPVRLELGREKPQLWLVFICA